MQILDDCGVLVAIPTSYPMTPNLKLSATSGIPLEQDEASNYRRLIGRLLYLKISRPNICFSIHKLSQYVAKPYSHHLAAAHHLLRYLKSTAGQGILLRPSNDFHLKDFADSDWGLVLIQGNLSLVFASSWESLL